MTSFIIFHHFVKMLIAHNVVAVEFRPFVLNEIPSLMSPLLTKL
jgi:hypothetical protein